MHILTQMSVPRNWKTEAHSVVIRSNTVYENIILDAF